MEEWNREEWERQKAEEWKCQKQEEWWREREERLKAHKEWLDDLKEMESKCQHVLGPGEWKFTNFLWDLEDLPSTLEKPYFFALRLHPDPEEVSEFEYGDVYNGFVLVRAQDKNYLDWIVKYIDGEWSVNANKVSMACLSCEKDLLRAIAIFYASVDCCVNA